MSLDKPPIRLAGPPRSPTEKIMRDVWLSRVAVDVVLFGHDRRAEVAVSYGMNTDELDELINHEDMRVAIERAASEASTPAGQARLAASVALFANIETLHRIANDPTAYHKDRVSAIKELRDVATPPREQASSAPAGGAPLLTLNIGVPGTSQTQTFTIDMPVADEVVQEEPADD